MKNPIIEEVRRVHKNTGAEHGNDWDSLACYLIEVQEASPAKVVPYRPENCCIAGDLIQRSSES